MRTLLALSLALVSTIASAQRPSGEILKRLLERDQVVIIVDASPEGTRSTSQSLRVYEQGRLTLHTLASTGLRRPTPTGSFRFAEVHDNFYSSTHHSNMSSATMFMVGHNTADMSRQRARRYGHRFAVFSAPKPHILGRRFGSNNIKVSERAANIIQDTVGRHLDNAIIVIHD